MTSNMILTDEDAAAEAVHDARQTKELVFLQQMRDIEVEEKEREFKSSIEVQGVDASHRRRSGGDPAGQR